MLSTSRGEAELHIDVNPRLVEPGNAWRAGVDLVEVLLRVSLGNPPAPRHPGGPASAPTSFCWPCWPPRLGDPRLRRDPPTLA